MSETSGSAPNLQVGFSSVDAQPQAAFLLAGMEATATWPAVRQLRAWEREHLHLRPGQRVLDVGCGLGDVATVLAADVAPDGEVVGIDASDAMLEEATPRAASAGADVSFRRGDALALGEPDGSFDACRSERTLQWVPDIAAAVNEMVRVLRPGGRLSLIDTDWRTLMADLPDVSLSPAVNQAFYAVRGPGVAAGSRLLNVTRDAGLVDIDVTAAAHVWTEWDPDNSPGPSGLYPFREVFPQLVESGAIDADTVNRFVEGVVDAARRDRLCM